MPALVKEWQSLASSEGSIDSSHDSHSGVMENFEYPALSFPGYSEKPLSEQLEPLAVVGLGMLNSVVYTACVNSLTSWQYQAHAYRVPPPREDKFSARVLGHDDEQENWADAKGSIITVQC